MDISQYSGWPLALVTASVVVYLYYRNAISYWKKRGVPGPDTVYPFLGNIFPILMSGEEQIELVSKYGKVFGLYNGLQPALIVSDVDIMKEICIKNFNVFPNHHNAEFNSELADGFLLNTKDDQWRNTRAIISPTFTVSKMRRMHKLIDQCADQMLEALQERLKTNPVVDLGDLFSLFTMDSIATCCYALRLASYKNETSFKTAAKRDEFVRLGTELFQFKLWRIFAVLIFKTEIVKFFKISMISTRTEWAFARQVQQMIKNRRKSDKNHDDFLQMLISVQSDTDKANGTPVRNGKGHVAGDGSQSSEGHDGRDGTKSPKTLAGTLSETEVLANATYILLAAFDTTATLLIHCFYTLSFHQSIQEKLYQTIKSLAEYDDQNRATFDYDALISCEYLDAVVSETLRSHPPIIVTDRIAEEDYKLASHDIVITKGMRVMFLLNAMMQDPSVWPEPEVFNPDRFSPAQREGRDPYTLCPFGVGPRQCVGFRFALTETKLAIAKLLLAYRFEPAPGTRYPGESGGRAGFNGLKRPEVIAIKR